MKIRKESLFRIGGYALFALMSFLVSLYLTFPFELLEAQALRLLEAKSQCRITISESSFGLPAKVSAQGIKATCPKRLFFKGKPGEMRFELASLDLELAPLPLLLDRRSEIEMESRLFGGKISGHLRVENKAGEVDYHLMAEGAGFQLSQLDSGLSGQISLKGEGAWAKEKPSEGEARLSLTLDQTQIESFAGRSIPTGALTFSSIEGRLSLKGGRVMLEAFSAKGETLDLPSGSGSLLLRAPIDRSILTLSLRAFPKGDLKKMATLFIRGYRGQEPLKIRMRGPLKAPQLSLNGKPIKL